MRLNSTKSYDKFSNPIAKRQFLADKTRNFKIYESILESCENLFLIFAVLFKMRLGSSFISNLKAKCRNLNTQSSSRAVSAAARARFARYSRAACRREHRPRFFGIEKLVSRTRYAAAAGKRDFVNLISVSLNSNLMKPRLLKFIILIL